MRATCACLKQMGHVASRLCVAADVETVVVVIRDDDSDARFLSLARAEARERRGVTPRAVAASELWRVV